ncbi:O-antigen ligase family protein [Carnimonas nigrificans]|uniref:O-antigen ligase family protein n=1 Tax=Carnimonas nigrificans TaxID=64323 RepID=UPI00046F72BF|nr:O-antigen ligase family protein [Carnimonas nigrificans]
MNNEARNNMLSSGRLVNMLVLLLVGVGLLFMGLDRNASAHMLYTAAFIATMHMVIVHLGKYSLGLRPRAGVDLSILGIGLGVMLVSQFFWWCYLGGYVQYGWMNRYVAHNMTYWISSFIIIFYLLRYYQGTGRSLDRILMVLMGLLYLYIFYLGMYEYYVGHERIVLKVGNPVPAAFVLYSFTLAMLLVLVRNMDMYISRYLIVMVAILGGGLIAWTGTRSVLVIYGLTLLVGVCYLQSTLFSQPGKKCLIPYIVMILCLITVAGMLLNTRFSWLYSDLTRYLHGDVTGSLGARFTMWKAGWMTFAHWPWGYSANNRYNVVLEQLNILLRNDPNAMETLRYVSFYNLHNEFVEVASLQGIPGLCALILYYMALLWVAIRRAIVNICFGIFVIAMLLYGVMDPLFNSDKIQLCVAFMLPLLIFFSIPVHHQTREESVDVQ